MESEFDAQTASNAFSITCDKGDRAITPIMTRTLGLCIAGCLISIAIWQIRIICHFRAELRRHGHYEKREMMFLLRQSFRRLQMHILLGIAGLFMLAGIYIPPLTYTLGWSIVWCIVIFLMFWAILLALIDYVSIRLYYGRCAEEDRIERLKFDYEIREYQKQKKNEKKTDEPDKQ